jgi:anti-sigma regulatory factor (Ser/Thr protein kinase)
MALDELLSNVISYGYQDSGEHKIRIKFSFESNILTIIIQDDGQPFDPTQIETPDLESSVEDRKIGGLGIHIVRNMMDEFSYERIDNKNVITLKKTDKPNK